METVVAISINPQTAAQITPQDLTSNSSSQNALEPLAGGQISSNVQDSSAVLTNVQNPGAGLLALGAVASSLNRALSISDVAGAAGQQVSDLLSQLKTLASSAADTSASSSARQGMDASFQGLLGQIQDAVNSASFNGANLLNGSQVGGSTVVASADGTSTVTLSTTNLSLGGPVLTLAPTSNIATATAAAGALGQIDVSLSNVTQALAALDSQASLIAGHAGLVAQASGTLQAGQVNGDLNSESALLQALQVQQQLGALSAPIANQAPQTLLSLFR
jgi:flagellin